MHSDSAHIEPTAKARTFDNPGARKSSVGRVPAFANHFSEPITPTHPSQFSRRRPSRPPDSLSPEPLRSLGPTRLSQSNPPLPQAARRMLLTNKPLVCSHANDCSSLVVPQQRKQHQRDVHAIKHEAADDAAASTSENSPDAFNQSDFCESEAQTLPYSLEYITSQSRSAKQSAFKSKRHSSQPEVLHLSDLEYASGLHAGKTEGKRIELRRERRQWESKLPILSDSSCFEERRRMMEERERTDRAARERGLEELSERRIDALKDAMNRDRNEVENASDQRIAQMRKHKAASARLRLDKSNRDRLRQLRRIANDRDSNLSIPSYAQPSLADHMVNPASSKHAPLQRNGAVCISHLPQNAVSHFPSRSLEKLQQCKQVSNRGAIEELPEKPQPLEDKQRRTTKERRKLQQWDDLNTIRDMLETSKSRHGRRGIGNCWPAPLADEPKAVSTCRLDA